MISAPAFSINLHIFKNCTIVIPLSTPSLQFNLTDIIKLFPTAFLILWIISITILALFSSLPPYSSFLLLKAGDKNWLNKVKWAQCNSIPSKFAFFALIAPFKKSS